VRAVWSTRVVGLSKSAIALATRFVRVIGLSKRCDCTRLIVRHPLTCSKVGIILRI
jgi:hypothetical protein